MDLNGHKIILGSNSPRRRELLAGLGLPFEVDTENSFVESFPSGTSAYEVPRLMCEGKSGGFHRPLAENEILITADTIVICEDKVLGKPHSREEAADMLRSLSGRVHEVLTGVTIRSERRKITFLDKSEVHFRVLSEEEINYYIDTCKPFDKAGAYGIQEWIGYIGIYSINGSYFNVMGFPVHRVYEELKAFVK